MKEYTTRYDTAKLQGVCYSFKAESDEAAKCFVKHNFAGITNVQLYDDTDTVKACAGRLVATIKTHIDMATLVTLLAFVSYVVGVYVGTHIKEFTNE